MSAAGQGLHICELCEEDVVPAGKRLCEGCNLVQTVMMRFPERNAVVVVVPWNWKDKLLGVVGGALIVCCLWTMWLTFGR